MAISTDIHGLCWSQKPNDKNKTCNIHKSTSTYQGIIKSYVKKGGNIATHLGEQTDKLKLIWLAVFTTLIPNFTAVYGGVANRAGLCLLAKMARLV